MSVQRSLFWHQGLFLQPQHFQLLERSVQALLEPMQSHLQPHFWGVWEMDVQRAALGTRSFGLLKGTFLFPDGTYAVLPGNAVSEARSFEESWVQGGKPFPVYLGVRKWNDGAENVTVLERLEGVGSVTTRFVALKDAEDVRDLHAGGPPGQVKRLSYVLRIVWESEREQLGDYALVPLACLERMGEEIRLSDQFVPPVLNLTASAVLSRIVREIRDQIASRSRQLEEYKRQRGVQTAEFGSRDMVYLLALRSLNRFVPLLHHYTDTQPVHPWAVYGALRQLIGELSSFSERVNVLGESDDGGRVLPPYDHRGLYRCFDTAQALVSQLLDEITAGPEYVRKLVFDGTYYASELEPAVFEAQNRFYLVLKTQEDPKVVLQSVSTAAKLSTREQLPLLIARAIPGINLTHLPVPPQELPRRANSIYFAVDHHSDQWAMVAKRNNVALYWDSAPEDLEAELMVVGRS
ncbi:MAG: type VI secretion system baseplate subunit TssK [Deltaproteobacteria bacterium]|nr:type VI secretion system baseplate subunit TssK [Deltaproteobacteria bacterium]